MRFSLLAARLAFVAMLLAVSLALLAIILVRAGAAPFAVGIEIMTASVVLGLIALVMALVWLVAALRHNRGDGKRAEQRGPIESRGESAVCDQAGGDVQPPLAHRLSA